MKRRALWIAASALSLVACGGEAPVGPKLEAAPQTQGSGASSVASGSSVARASAAMTVVSGDTGQPVSGASVTVAGRPFTTDAAGRFMPPDPVLADQQVDITAPGFLKRETLVRSETRFALWPDRSGFSASFTQEAVYFLGFTQDNKLTRPTTGLSVVMGAGTDGSIGAVHSEAAARLTAASGGSVPFSVVDSAAGATITVVVDPGHAFLAQNPGALAVAEVPFVANAVGAPSGKITYRDAGSAKVLALVAHELGHHFGLGHPTSLPGLMNPAVDAGRSEYSDAEKLAIKMMLLRRPGNAFPDNDRAVTAAAARRRGRALYVCTLVGQE